MSQITLKSETRPADPASPPLRHEPADARVTRVSRYENVAVVIAQMTPAERARAYESGVFTLGELNGAARLRPDLMPIVNGEFEWIAFNAE